jgi:two-component system, OmpR family, sensor histidine kinase CiaH
MTRAAHPGAIRTRSVRKVALSAALVALITYVLVGAVADLVVASRLSNGVNGRIADRLGDVKRQYSDSGGKLPTVVDGPSQGGDIDDAPVVLWFVPEGASRATALERNAPFLPVEDFAVKSDADRTIGDSPFRIAGETVVGGRFIAGTSTGAERSAFTIVLVIELVLAPFAFLGVLGSAWLIGRRAADPVERARRQQQAFTADASHELRTPLTVIEAEVGLALSRTRDAAAYRETLERVSDESQRLRLLVEELLWLSRLDAAPSRPPDELADLAVIAAGCVDRFGVVAMNRGTDLALAEGPDSVLLRAPAEWLDRLGGVLVDNACKYSGRAGIVRIGVSQSGASVTLFVEDSGPGIEEHERERIFDRFHRGAERELGAGLGLAIADAVVQATEGTWSVGSSSLGGARFAVTWAQPGQLRYPSRL